jgi:GNAT superfamily N-acetyltransferase
MVVPNEASAAPGAGVDRRWDLDRFGGVVQPSTLGGIAPLMHLTRDSYSLTDDASQFDIETIIILLQSTYWAADRTREQVELSLHHSVCVGLFHQSRQVGLARAVTDCGAYTWLCDVVVHPDHRGKGLGRWMLERLLEHPSVVPTRVILVTKDAQEFYKDYRFEAHPYQCMIRYP